MLQGISFHTVGAATQKVRETILVPIFETRSLSAPELAWSVCAGIYLVNMGLRNEGWSQWNPLKVSVASYIYVF